MEKGATKTNIRATKPDKKKACEALQSQAFVGGERGIRTHGRLPYTAFPVLHLTTTRTALHFRG